MKLYHSAEVRLTFDAGWTGADAPYPPIGFIASYNKAFSGTGASGTVTITPVGGGPAAVMTMHCGYLVVNGGAAYSNSVNMTNSDQYGVVLRSWNAGGGPLAVDAAVVAYF